MSLVDVPCSGCPAIVAGMSRFLQQSYLPAVVRCVLHDAMEHPGNGGFALRSEAREIVVAHPGYDFTEAFMALVEPRARLCPAILRDRSRSGPVLSV